MNTQKLRTQLREILSLHAYDIGDLSDRIDALFAEFESQPLAVVVPAIQWGEWRFLNGWTVKDSTCGKYRIVRDGQRFRLASTGIYYDTEEAAIAACQAHKEAQITKALEGCGVVVWRDPKIHIDALKKAIADTVTDRIEAGKCLDTGASLVNLHLAVESVVKAWEAGK